MIQKKIRIASSLAWLAVGANLILMLIAALSAQISTPTIIGISMASLVMAIWTNWWKLSCAWACVTPDKVFYDCRTYPRRMAE